MDILRGLVGKTITGKTITEVVPMGNTIIFRTGPRDVDYEAVTYYPQANSVISASGMPLSASQARRIPAFTQGVENYLKLNSRGLAEVVVKKGLPQGFTGVFKTYMTGKNRKRQRRRKTNRKHK